MKFKFNLHEFLIAFAGTVFFVLFSMIKTPLAFEEELLHIGIFVLAYFAMIYGPVVGGVIGIMGYSVARYLVAGTFHWSMAWSFAIFAIMIGSFQKKYKTAEGEFGAKQLLLFQIVQITANLITWVLIASLLDILLYGQEAVYLVRLGFYAFIYNAVLTGVCTPILGWIYSSFVTIRKKNIKLRNEK